MSPSSASVLCCLFILWCLIKTRSRSYRTSTASWIPLIWAIILGSRPLSSWLGVGGEFANTDDYLEGSPYDRFFFLLLILLGIAVLFTRRLDWRTIFRRNKWMMVYFLYLGITVVWSDYSFVSFKRWIKDMGNVVMALLILTEVDPLLAFKSLFLKCSIVLIPTSLLFIKYYPNLGRYYDRWTGQAFFTGVATDKNAFGNMLLVCGIILFWLLISLPKKSLKEWLGQKSISYCILILMTLMLLQKAKSSTAVTCWIVGICVLLGCNSSAVRKRMNRLGLYGAAAVCGIVLLHLVFSMGDVFVALVGRDLTFTGRTEIWKLVLKEDTNPLVGVGFYSFWLGDRTDRLSEKYFYHLNEAHNGYLETYLNTGFVGLFLLAAMLASSLKQTRLEVAEGHPFGPLRLAFFVAGIIYNFTEASFDRLNLIWFVLLLVIIHVPGARRPTLAKRNVFVPA